MRIKTVSQYIFRHKDNKFSIKLSVSLLDGNGDDSVCSIYEAPTASYLTIGCTGAIVMQIKSEVPKGVNDFDRSKYVRITDESMYQVNKSLQSFYRKLMRGDLFTYYKSGNIDVNPRRDDMEYIYLKTGSYIQLEPAVIMDEHSQQLPGVNLYMNMTENKVELTIDEYEYIMYRFNTINIQRDSNQLVIMKLLTTSNMSSQDNVTKTKLPKSNISQASIFERHSKVQSEDVVDNRVPEPKQITSIDDVL